MCWKVSEKSVPFHVNTAQLQDFSQQKNTKLTAARCHENWPIWLVNNFSQKIHGTHGSWVLSKLAEKSMLFRSNTAELKELSQQKKKTQHSRQQGAMRIGKTD